MKDYLEKRREELRKQGGFTLMEMLIVVAIIAVLVAIAIPVFTGQLERAREATDAANIRSAYAEVTTKYLTDGQGTSAKVTKTQTADGWVDTNMKIAGTNISEIDNGGSGEVSISIDSEGNVTLGNKTLTATSTPAGEGEGTGTGE